jgi:hypothetical protein
MKNALYITISIGLLSLSGCYRHVRTSVGEGSSSPFHSEWDSASAAVTCREVRDAQDDETTEEAFALAERVGLMARTSETPVRVRDAVATTCALDDAREAAGEARAVTTRDGCERLLAPDGISADAEVMASTTGRAAVDSRLTDAVLPMVQMRLLFASFMADAQAWCRSQEASASVFAPGMGFAPGFPGAGYGSLFASGGLGLSVFGLGAGIGGFATSGGMAPTVGFARGDIVLNGFGMRPDAVALVTVNGATTTVTPGTRDLHFRMAGSATYAWSVDCMVNGVTRPDLRQAGMWGPDAGRLDLDAICSRY